MKPLSCQVLWRNFEYFSLEKGVILTKVSHMDIKISKFVSKTGKTSSHTILAGIMGFYTVKSGITFFSIGTDRSLKRQE